MRAIEKQFYRNFTDYIVETIKLLHISDREISRRMKFEGLEIIDRLLDDHKSIVAYFSHTGNWEWAPSIRLHSRHAATDETRFCQVYRPLRNRRFDRLMLRIRSRFGSISIPKTRTLRDLLAFVRQGVPSITGFMSDQKPSHGDHVHVLDFFNRPTAVITGTEALANRLGMAVVYWDMVKTSRGHYTIRVRLLADDASKVEPWTLTARYFSELEKTIRHDPAIWLWSHRRWANSPATWNDVDPQT
ncbi:MAG: lysophospholipid acyltransferase family protein, partial [Muribaculaceae bacterium]|nr:lysophospholipid acyltransferase family protein [Muribaculaceae bacterium]